MTRPAATVFCGRCGRRIHEFDYVVRGGLPLHEACWHADKEPAGPRKILGVELSEAGGMRVLKMREGMGYTNVRLVHEKLRVETTWRWVWAVVADAKEEG